MWENLTRAGVLLTRDLEAAGYGREDVRRLVRGGELVRLDRGLYAPSPGRPWSTGARHALRARGATLLDDEGSAASHISAALLHGLPTWGVPLDTVHLMRIGDGRPTRRAGLVRHARVPGATIGRMGPVPVVDVADAVVQVGLLVPRGGDEAVFLVCADAAVASGRTTVEAIREAATRHACHTGVGRVRAWIPLIEAGHTTPGETRLGAALRRLGRRCRTQVPIVTNGRRYLVDFELDDEPVVVEFDGRLKYTEPEVLFDEKRREDDIRATGREFVRVVWQRVGDLTWLEAQLEAASRRASARLGERRTVRVSSHAAGPGRGSV